MGTNPAKWFITAAAFPLLGEMLVADPSIAVAGDRYYLIGTEDCASVACSQIKPVADAVFPVYVSEDLHSWRPAKTAAGDGRCLIGGDRPCETPVNTGGDAV